MRWLYAYLFPIIWIAFMLYWRLISAGNKTTRRLESFTRRAIRVVLFSAAIVILIFQSLPVAWLNRPILPRTPTSFWVGAAITIAGLLFAVWARRHLGANWSRSVSVKQDHQLITSGPYKIVRHPIYTGILTGILGSAIAIGEVRGIIALLLIYIALRSKWRLEEQWMREEFGQTYTDYARRVPAVVPRPM